jgi:hypothetical protein
VFGCQIADATKPAFGGLLLASIGPGSFEHAGYGGINIGFGTTQVFWGYM